MALLSMGVIPIINENDAVAVDELKIGDNDTLSATVATLVDADALIIFIPILMDYILLIQAKIKTQNFSMKYHISLLKLKIWLVVLVHLWEQAE